MVPWNHDVDRDYVALKLPLWDCHEAIRKMTDIERTDSLNTQLHKDPSKTLLSPLAHIIILQRSSAAPQRRSSSRGRGYSLLSSRMGRW
jgi:hypothetical protein